MLGKQAPQAVMMVRPTGFRFNPETAASNAFQTSDSKENAREIRIRALSEFTNLVKTLKTAGVEVIEFEPDHPEQTPDAVFPNNWVSTHHDGRVFLYPMMAPSRRLERRLDYIKALDTRYGFRIKEIIDLSSYQERQLYLEGTGSLVIDYKNQVIYANHSPRTSRKLVLKMADLLNCSCCQFYAVDEGGQDVYHTNVMMCVGDGFTVVCLDALKIPEERARLEASLISNGHEVIAITIDQMSQFAGNMMQLSGAGGESILSMSSNAFQSLNQHQRNRLEKYARILHAPIDTIEKYGGGSVRCMLAGIFLPRKSQSK